MVMVAADVVAWLLLGRGVGLAVTGAQGELGGAALALWKDVSVDSCCNLTRL